MILFLFFVVALALLLEKISLGNDRDGALYPLIFADKKSVLPLLLADNPLLTAQAHA